MGVKKPPPSGDEAAVTYKNSDYNSYTGEVVIPEYIIFNNKGYFVTGIGDQAFYYCSGLTFLSIGNGVTSIGKYAFDSCKLRNGLIKCSTPPTADFSFSDQTYYHTTLYIPTNSWDAYAYDDMWFKFINIRETATEEEQLNTWQAYTLMDANTFAYSVYDPVNDCIGTIRSVGINKDNPNHSWQILEDDSQRYLYNIGARKYARKGARGLELSDQPEAIGIGNGKDGIVFGNQSSQQWAFVSNENLNADKGIVDGIEGLTPAFSEGEGEWYDLSGRRINSQSSITKGNLHQERQKNLGEITKQSIL